MTRSLSDKERSPPLDGEHRNVNRIAAIVGALSAADISGLRSSEIAELTGLTRATAHRLLGSMVGAGLLEMEEAGMRYRLSGRFLAWGSSGLLHEGVLSAAVLEVDILAEQIGDSIALHISNDGHAVCILAREGSFPIKAQTYRLGDRHRFGDDAVSFAFLSSATELDNPEAIQARALLQSRGYLVDQGRLRPQINTVAVPVYRDCGKVVAAISLSAISTRLDPERIEHIAPMLVDASKAITSSLTSKQK